MIGPEAWLEGLRQKRWTLATILIILNAAHMCDTTASLLGQGDNQVIVLRIPSAQYLQDRRLTPDQYTQQFLQVLERVCTESGIVIKVPESWKSRRLLEYGRKYFMDGVQVSSALKKVSRLTSEPNQTIYTLNTVLAGLFSSGASIAGHDIYPFSIYADDIRSLSDSLENTSPISSLFRRMDNSSPDDQQICGRVSHSAVPAIRSKSNARHSESRPQHYETLHVTTTVSQ